MKTYQHITGKTLTLVFSPERALSKAKLDGVDVTKDLRYLKAGREEGPLRMFGFAKWGPDAIKVFSQLDEHLSTIGLSVCNAYKVMHFHDVLLCDAKDYSYIHKRPRAVLRYYVEEQRFLKFVRIIDLSDSMCQKLMEGNW